MSFNTFGHLFRVTTWGESHGPALGATVDGCPPGIALDEPMLQHWLDKRKPGQSRYTTQRREADAVEILSGVYEGQTTGTPIQLMIRNTDQRSKDYSDIAAKFRPGHADITYWQKYGIRDPRGGGRSSARETAARVAAGGVARAALEALVPGLRITGYMVQMGPHGIDRARVDLAEIGRNPFFVPDAQAAADWAGYLDGLRKSGESVGAVIEVVASGVPAGLGAPIYAKLDSDLAAAMMTINAVKGVEIGAGMAAATLRMPTKSSWARTGRAMARTMRAGFWAGYPRARMWSCALPSNRHRQSCRRAAPLICRGARPRLSPRAGTTPAWAFAPCRWAKR